MRRDGTGWDETGRDGVGGGGMGRSGSVDERQRRGVGLPSVREPFTRGLGWDGMGWNGMGWDERASSRVAWVRAHAHVSIGSSATSAVWGDMGRHGEIWGDMGRYGSRQHWLERHERRLHRTGERGRPHRLRRSGGPVTRRSRGVCWSIAPRCVAVAWRRPRAAGSGVAAAARLCGDERAERRRLARVGGELSLGVAHL